VKNLLNKVLIVNEDQNVASSLSMVLDNMGFDSLTVKSEKEATLLLEKSLPKAMLLNYWRNLDFLKGVHSILRSEKTPPPLILIGTLPVEELQSVSRSMGGAAVLRAPFNLDDFENCIQNCLSPNKILH